jgi:hypothetical protein
MINIKGIWTNQNGSILIFEEVENGLRKIHTTWILSRQFEDSEREKPTQAWNTFLINSDVFVQTSTVLQHT